MTHRIPDLWDAEPGYLNTASYGLPPRPAWAALQAALADWRAGRTSWEDWVAAECAEQPLLIVLEDMHWGDLPTVKFVDAALRSSSGAPLLVLAFARPEVHELFPKLWEERGLQEIALRGLLGSVVHRGQE